MGIVKLNLSKKDYDLISTQNVTTITPRHYKTEVKVKQASQRWTNLTSMLTVSLRKSYSASSG